MPSCLHSHGGVMSEKLKAVTIRWPADLVRQVKIAAAVEATSVQQLTREAVEDRLRRREALAPAE